MKLSVMSYTIVRTGWFKDNKLEGLKKICRLAQEIGADGIDWVTTYDIPPAEVRKVMDDNGLKTVCYTHAISGLSQDTFAQRCATVDSVYVIIKTAVKLGRTRSCWLHLAMTRFRATSYAEITSVEYRNVPGLPARPA